MEALVQIALPLAQLKLYAESHLPQRLLTVGHAAVVLISFGRHRLWNEVRVVVCFFAVEEPITGQLVLQRLALLKARIKFFACQFLMPIFKNGENLFGLLDQS